MKYIKSKNGYTANPSVACSVKSNPAYLVTQCLTRYWYPYPHEAEQGWLSVVQLDQETSGTEFKEQIQFENTNSVEYFTCLPNP